MDMKVSTWKNGSENQNTGSGYGIRISKEHHKYFSDYSQVILEINEIKYTINLTASFWDKCHEIRSRFIGLFLIQNNLKTWAYRQPHKLKLIYIKDNIFKLTTIQ